MPLHVLDAAVDGDHGHAGIDGRLQRGRHGADVERRDDDGVDLLRDGGFDVARLLGHLVFAVALDQLDAALGLGFRLQLLLHVDEEGEGQARQRGRNGQVLAGCKAGSHAEYEADGGKTGTLQKMTTIHGVFP